MCLTWWILILTINFLSPFYQKELSNISQEDNTYATIQHPHRRQQSNLVSTGAGDDLGEYATLSRIAQQPPGSNNSSLRDAPNVSNNLFS